MPDVTKRFFPVISLPATLVSFVMLLTACGGTSQAPTGAPASPVANDLIGSESHDGPRILARSAQLSTHLAVKLLTLPAGRLLVSCQRGKVVAALEGKRDSAEVVVKTGNEVVTGAINRYAGDKNLGRTFTAPKLSLPDIQTWIVTGFAMANVTPTVMTLAATRGAPGTSYRCGVSVVATVGPPRGTLTR